MTFGEWPEHKAGYYRVHHEELGPDIPDEYGSSMVGPFGLGQVWRPSVDGYGIPHVLMGPEDPDNPEGRWCVTLDERLVFSFESKAEIERMLPLLAHSMAVAAGYSCHGKNSVYNPNPYKRRMVQVDINP